MCMTSSHFARFWHTLLYNVQHFQPFAHFGHTFLYNVQHFLPFRALWAHFLVQSLTNRHHYRDLCNNQLICVIPLIGIGQEVIASFSIASMTGLRSGLRIPGIARKRQFLIRVIRMQALPVHFAGLCFIKRIRLRTINA